MGSMQHATYSRRAAQCCCHIREDQGTFFRQMSDHYRLILKDIMRKMDLFEGWGLRCIKQQFLTLSFLIFFLPDAIKRAHISKPSFITINRSDVAEKNHFVFATYLWARSQLCF